MILLDSSSDRVSDVDNSGGRATAEPGRFLLSGRYARYAFAVAAVLTITMLGWQGWHLVESYRNVDHRQSGECPTRAVEEVYFAAAHHGDLIDDLEHALLVAPAAAISAWSAEWRDHFWQSGTELDGAIARALNLVTPELADAVHRVDATSGGIETAASDVIAAATRNDVSVAVAMLDAPAYRYAHDEYVDSVESLVRESRRFFEAQLRSEHRGELISVAVAMAIFAATLGAWVVFLRRIKVGQRRLADESRQRRQAEADLFQAQKMEAMGTMAGAIAHDFNNIVTAIWGSASQARAQVGADSPIHSSLARIEAASEQANEIVHSLLTLGRRTTIELQPVDLGELVERTATLMQTVIPPSIEVAVENRAERGPWVAGDPVLLQQALMNLVLNARDAMPEGGHLSVTLHTCPPPGSVGERACVEVADTGVGMTPEVMSRIFEPFFTTRATGEGTGLGLAMVHSIIDGHGGVVRCESVPGSGTVFTVSVPVMDEFEGVVAGVRDEHGFGRVTGSGAVLVAEDHRQVRELIAGALEAAGYKAVATASGAELLAAHERCAEDVVALVIDLEIPEPDGLACIRRLRSAGSVTPIVLITGTPAPDLEAEVGELAVVLRKPFEISRLLDTLASLMPSGAGRHG